eukprot:4255752-Prymnesium_polylepis.1
MVNRSVSGSRCRTCALDAHVALCLLPPQRPDRCTTSLPCPLQEVNHLGSRGVPLVAVSPPRPGRIGKARVGA